jgi:hypothetical protein
MTDAETNPQERGLGKPCAGKPPARFDEGESSATRNPFRCSLYSTQTRVERFAPGMDARSSPAMMVRGSSEKKALLIYFYMKKGERVEAKVFSY